MDVILPLGFGFIIAAFVLYVYIETGQMVLLEHLKDDWRYRIGDRLRNNRYRGASRTCYQMLVILWYIIKAFAILAFCGYSYILIGLYYLIKWIWERFRARKQELADLDSEEPEYSDVEEQPCDDFVETESTKADTKSDPILVSAFQAFIDIHGVGYIATNAELKKFVLERYEGVAEGSILPSDYCYNRINDGIGLSKPTLFEHIAWGQYRCLGLGYPYNGVIYHKDQVVGYCTNGIRDKIYGITDKVTPVRTTKAQKSRDPSPRLRFEVLARDKFTCRFCGASPTKDPSVTLHIDHIIPWSKGGETSLDNLQTLCSKCNLGKSDLIIDIPSEEENGG